MKPCIKLAAAVACFAFFTPLESFAAPCPHGTIKYRSAGVCITKASAARIGIYRPRHAKASMKHRAKKRPPSLQKAQRTPAPIVAASFPTAAPPWRQVTPMIEGQIDEALRAPAPTVFVHPRFGALIAMPDSPAVWAARNAATFGEN